MKIEKHQKLNILNILRFSFDKDNFFTLIDKIFKRFRNKKGTLTPEQNNQWLRENLSDFNMLAKEIDSELWDETKVESKKILEHGNKKLKNLDFHLGGGGYYNLLYFFVRKLKPKVVLETGVGAGFSSLAILKGLHKNNKGKLYSSDLPYFRLDDPEKYVGYLVEEKYKHLWELFQKGDKINFEKILNKFENIDIFHYDSDKTYSGREYALERISSHLSNTSVIIMDDLQDNSFFYDYLEKNNISEFQIYEFGEKFVGVIGDFSKHGK